MPDFELKSIDQAPKIDFASPLRWSNGTHKNEKAHWLGRTTEWLFDFGGEGHRVDAILPHKAAVIARGDYSKGPGFWMTALKVMLLATGIIPLLFVIGKAIYRAANNVVETIPDEEMKSYRDSMQDLECIGVEITALLGNLQPKELIASVQDLSVQISEAEYYYSKAFNEEDQEAIQKHHKELCALFETLKDTAKDPFTIENMASYMEEIVEDPNRSDKETELRLALETINYLDLEIPEAKKARFEDFRALVKQADPIGIPNGRNNCYINSFLQVMMAIPELTNYIEKTTDDNDLILNELKAFKIAYDTKDEAACVAARNRLRRAAFRWEDDGADPMYEGPENDQNDPGAYLLRLFEKTGQGIYNKYAHDPSLGPVQPALGPLEASVILKVDQAKEKGPYSFQEILERNFKDDKISSITNEGVPVVLPENLLFQFARYNRSGAKICDPIQFPRDGIIDLANCMENPSREKALYQLVAVISHIGATPRNGHYTAEVNRGGQWYYCDDASVRPRDRPNTQNGYYFVLKRIHE